MLATAWTLLALFTMGKEPPAGTVEFVLHTQDESGWWSIFPADANVERDASTAATAWSLLAIHEGLRTGLLPTTDTGAAEKALARGKRWLLDTRIPETARWYDYPNSDASRIESDAISGVAFHLLHLMGISSSVLHEIDASWLRELPDHFPSIRDYDVARDSWILSETKWERDTVRHCKLPWLVIGTVDAFDNADFGARFHALVELERFLSGRRPPDDDAQGVRWMQAELLIALRHLAGSSLLP